MTSIQRSVTIPDNHVLRLDIEVPPQIPSGEAEVTVLIVPARKRDNGRAIRWLRELAEAGGLHAIPDPAAWQREVRADRPLPGRA